MLITNQLGINENKLVWQLFEKLRIQCRKKVVEHHQWLISFLHVLGIKVSRTKVKMVENVRFSGREMSHKIGEMALQSEISDFYIEYTFLQ